TLLKAHADAGERDGGRRVRVNDTINVGALPIALQMHEDFRGGTQIAVCGVVRSDFLTVHIDDNQLIRGHVPLRQAAGRTKDALAIDAGADIATGALGVVVLAHQTPDFTDFLAESPFIWWINDHD